MTPEDIRRVANTYFKPENRTIAIYYTKKKAEGAVEDPALAGLTDQEKAQIGQMKAMLAQAKAEQLKSNAGADRTTSGFRSCGQTELYQGGQKDAGRSPQAT